MENFIIGLTGAFGSGCTFLADEMLVKHFGFKKYTLSDILKDTFKEQNGRPHESRHELQEFGNHIRNTSGKDFLAKKVVEIIESEKLPASQKILIDSIRNPYEVEYLRQKYPNFFLIAIFADYEKRWERVKGVYSNKRDAFDDDEYKDQGSDEPEHGQKVSKCFFEADLVISNNEYISCDTPNNAHRDMYSKINNYLTAFQNPKSSHPTIKESLMAMAYTNGRRSKCKKRRVGAIIVDELNNILSSGFNDVPRKLDDCGSKLGECYRDKRKRELKTDILNEIHSIQNNTVIADRLIKKVKILELCRALHAEENAILNLVSSSSRTDFSACTLYATTYPCNLCANKIVQVGIKNVVYFEPYPVVEAKQIFDEGSVKAVPFEGVTFRAFFRAFTFEA
ncbi:MAG: deaminase [Clostridia bacterium]|nr:deaminase [Clostridia bacterium]